MGKINNLKLRQILSEYSLYVDTTWYRLKSHRFIDLHFPKEALRNLQLKLPYKQYGRFSPKYKNSFRVKGEVSHKIKMLLHAYKRLSTY